ncbi:MAG TPA: tail fiber protein [Stellaceae bacterium]|nr:tail fiber protein [Stellaceae bacterium]
MTTPYLGQIMIFGGNFAPRGWAFCNGQLMSIQQNTALFSLLGTYYGGNGISTFALPDLMSRLPIHQGTGLGLSTYVIGQLGGVTSVTVQTSSMPNHTHLLNATNTTATTPNISASVLPGVPTGGTNPPHFYSIQPSGDPALVVNPLAAGVCGGTGGNLPHTNMMPSLCLTFVIALQGIFPSRG